MINITKSSRAAVLSTALVVLCLGLAATGYYKVSAIEKTSSPRSLVVDGNQRGEASINSVHSPWLNLRVGKRAATEYVGDEAAVADFAGGSVRAVSVASADIDGDGFPDLISGFNSGDGGVVTLHRGNRSAFAPEDVESRSGLNVGEFAAPFTYQSQAVQLPFSPDYIAAVNSLNGVAVAANGGNSIAILTADENGVLTVARQINVAGQITALTSGQLNGQNPAGVLAVAIQNENGNSVIVMDPSAENILQTISAPSAVASLKLVAIDGVARSSDLFVLAGGGIFRFSNNGTSFGPAQAIRLPFQVADFALGEFIRDRQAKTEIAALSDNGSVYYLKNGTLDTRPFTESEMRANIEHYGRGRDVLDTSPKQRSRQLDSKWSVAEEHQLGISPFANGEVSVHLEKARLTGYGTDDLLVVDQIGQKVQILFKEPAEVSLQSFSKPTQIETVDFSSAPTAIVPMRLNAMAQEGFAVIQDGQTEPTPIVAAPAATFTVSKTADTNDGACNADCSLREAVRAANANPGADLILLGAGTFQLTLAGANENAAATGDLDITDPVTIQGNGSATTAVTAGTTTANGIDKVFSINPLFTTAFATSMSGMTIRYGRNPSSFGGDGFGGGFDWEGSGTGTLSINDLIVTGNSTLDGDGGGITATNSVAGTGSVTITNSTISNNAPARTSPGASPFGGGIFFGTTTKFSISGSAITGNNVNGSGGQGQGGGIMAFGPSGSGGISTIANTAISTNAAPSDGGGIYSTQPITFTTPIAFSGNSSGRFGGGLFINHSSGTTTLSKAVFTGNSATTTGSAIYLGSSTTANILNMSFSRLAGNTGGGLKGVATAGGTVNAENNWWGCPTGPAAAPCDTAGTAGGGTIDFNPWLQLKTSAVSTTLVTGQSTTLTTSFLNNSDGVAVGLANLTVLIGLPVTWSGGGGSISGAQTTIQSSGTATATFSSATAGSKSPGATVDSGVASVNITVNKADTTASIVSDTPDPTVTGQPYAVSFTLSVNAPGSGTPTGTVTISDGTDSCTATLPATSCNLTSTTVGSKTISVKYNGDANYNASPTVTTSHTVNAASTSISISSDTPDPSVVGQSYPVSFSLTVVAPGGGTPTGTVSISDGTGATCTATLPATSCSLTSTSVGAKTISATYNGDANYNASPAATTSHTVNKADTTATITGQSATTTGQNVPFTVSYSVSVNSPGAGSPTGNVTVSDGSQSCTGTVAAGQCTLTLTTVGSRTLTATYAGDANFNGSVSAGVSHTVTPVTAATVSVGGRVLTPSGAGVYRAKVSLTGTDGIVRSAMTNQFGFYRIDNVPVGQGYILSATSKAYVFEPQFVSITDQTSALNLVALP